eukprot:s563_g8.t1
MEGLKHEMRLPGLTNEGEQPNRSTATVRLAEKLSGSSCSVFCRQTAVFTSPCQRQLKHSTASGPPAEAAQAKGIIRVGRPISAFHLEPKDIKVDEMTEATAASAATASKRLLRKASPRVSRSHSCGGSMCTTGTTDGTRAPGLDGHFLKESTP